MRRGLALGPDGEGMAWGWQCKSNRMARGWQGDERDKGDGKAMVMLWQGDGQEMARDGHEMARGWLTAKLGGAEAAPSTVGVCSRRPAGKRVSNERRGVAARNVPAAQQGRARGDDGQRKLLQCS